MKAGLMGLPRHSRLTPVGIGHSASQYNLLQLLSPIYLEDAVAESTLSNLNEEAIISRCCQTRLETVGSKSNLLSRDLTPHLRKINSYELCFSKALFPPVTFPPSHSFLTLSYSKVNTIPLHVA